MLHGRRPSPTGGDLLRVILSRIATEWFMPQVELNQLEDRIQRLIAAYQQVHLERTRAVQERDRLQAMNTELREHIVSIVERLRALEETSP